MAVKVRKGQLISTFGPGAMMIDGNGTSIMTCGLDHWFTDIDGTPLESTETYQIQDRRLADRLGVNHFRLPPDSKSPVGDNADDHTKIRTPLKGVRFPRWHICSRVSCQRLVQVGSGAVRAQSCPECGSQLYQARFVTICKHGHIDDFPWNQWTHRTLTPECNGYKLRLRGVGSSSLAGITVECQQCSKSRSLAGITSTDGEDSVLSKQLADGVQFTCSGHMPWLGEHYETCDQQPIGILRLSTNVHFARIVSSIDIPIDINENLSDLMDLLSSQELLTQIDMLGALAPENQVQLIKNLAPPEITRYRDEQILQALEALRSGDKQTTTGFTRDEDATFRHQERNLILEGVDRKTLKATPVDGSLYSEWFSKYFSRVSLVHRLTETRAFLGFDRFIPSSSKSDDDYKEQLRRNKSSEDRDNWLPAHQVFGEGIYLEFNPQILKAWEKQDNVVARAQRLSTRIGENTISRRESVSARFLLVHTFAHVLMNQLVYDCGYSSASLRERIYVSDNPAVPMAGLLIYTASGDSEGSLGGLVRMGVPGQLEQVVEQTLNNAQWCSSDPVCTETGDSGGQGPGSLNLAACHSCALVPETSCEEFNLFLDRTCITSCSDTIKGFFDL